VVAVIAIAAAAWLISVVALGCVVTYAKQDG
jgi:hypothetical protein